MTSFVSSPRCSTRHTTVEQAIRDIAAGKPVVVIDNVNRENEGGLVIAAEKADITWMSFLVRHTSGFLCAPLSGEICDRLDLPPMTAVNEDRYGTAYTVTVDAAVGVTTGISAQDRARTARVLADTTSSAGDLTRPGHLVPLRAHDRGVLGRSGHAEAATDLARLAGLSPAAVIGEIVGIEDPLSMAREPELHRLAEEHDLTVVTITALMAWRRAQETHVVRNAETRLPLAGAEFRTVGYRDSTGLEHLALSLGDVTQQGVPTAVHTECLLGDVFGSVRCGCAARLQDTLEQVASQGHGIIVYLRAQDGDGSVLRSCADQRTTPDLLTAAHILRELGSDSVWLACGDHDTAAALRAGGITVTTTAPQDHIVAANPSHAPRPGSEDHPYAAARAS
jgi:3,4-dihydroxy 2-butanone 4-phosphate synthase/GTP cyclohydrolase II